MRKRVFVFVILRENTLRLVKGVLSRGKVIEVYSMT